MKAKSHITEVVIANALVAILERLDTMEDVINILAGRHLSKVSALQASSPIIPPISVDQAVLLEKLKKLTLKRHAVLTAILGGQSYQTIAKAMACDLTTVKLHLKAALDILGVRNRSELLVKSPDLLGFITDADYEGRYGVGKRWWLEEKPELMAVLTAKKPANNQHTK